MNRRERRAAWAARHHRDARLERPEERHTPGRARVHLGPHAAAAAPASVRLHIEEVVLHGFDPRGRYSVGDAVQHELTRLLTEHGLPTALFEARGAEQLDAGTFDSARDARPHALGAQVARAVYGGLKG